MSYDWLERELGQGGLFCPEKTISLSDSYDIKTEDTHPPFSQYSFQIENQI
jgi:hypothetical protein